MTQATNLEHPRFGFTPKFLINGSLTDTSLTGTAVARTAGLRFCLCAGLFTLTAGTGEVALIVEGSNDDGANWFEIARTPPTDLFDTDGQLIVLNDSGSGLVDLERFDVVRVRASIESGTPTFSLQVLLTGIARDSEKFLRTASFVQASGLPIATLPVQNSSMLVRPAGTLLVNCQVVTSGLVLGALTSVDAILQGRADDPSGSQAATWIDLGEVTITADGAQLMEVNSERLFSLGAYPNFRFRIEGTGVTSATTAFESVAFWLTLDSADWTADGDSASGGGGSDAGEVFITAEFGVPGVEGADTIDIAIQLFKADGSVLSEARPIEVIVYDTTQAGDFDLAANATFSAVAGGTAIAGLTTNRVLLTTDATGAATLSVLDASVETVFLSAVQPRAPLATPQVLSASQEATLTYA